MPLEEALGGRLDQAGPVPPERSTVEQHAEDEPSSRYRWIGIAAGLAMVGVVAVAATGLVSPELLTLEQYAVALAGTTIVLAITVIASLFLLDRTFTQLERHRNALDSQKDAIRQAREEAWERHEDIQKRRFGERIDELQARLEDVDTELAGLVQRIRWSSSPSPFGDIHETDVVPGIHAEERQALGQMGIDDTEQLWMANTKRIARTLGRETQTVRRWQQEAELMALPRVGSRAAEALSSCGVGSIPELAAWEPEALVDHLESRQMRLDTEPEEDLVSLPRVQAWVENARVHDPSAYRVHRHRAGSASA